MRLFFAVKLSEEIQARLHEEQGALKALGADVKWVERDNIHVTLKFLGEVPETRVPELSAAAEGIAESAQPWGMGISGLGCFPSVRSPRVVWAGITQGADQMAALAESVDKAMERLGFERENRPFKAHVTLGRVRSPQGKAQLAEGLARASQAHGGEMPVNHFCLMQSELRPSGPIYTVLKDFPLCAG
jgi:2'-5' RNA ligase